MDTFTAPSAWIAVPCPSSVTGKKVAFLRPKLTLFFLAMFFAP